MKAHVRTTADASLYLAKTIKLLSPDHHLYQSSRDALQRSLQTALDVQRDDGHFGQMYDLQQQAVVQWEGDAGLLWITALLAAWELFDDQPAFQNRLLTAAQRAGHCYAASIEQEYICGAPEDVSLAHFRRWLQCDYGLRRAACA